MGLNSKIETCSKCGHIKSKVGSCKHCGYGSTVPAKERSVAFSASGIEAGKLDSIYVNGVKFTRG